MNLKTHCKNGNTVDTWYDRLTRSWITQTKDAESNQVGEAQYAGNKPDRDNDIVFAIRENGGASGMRWVTVNPDPYSLILAFRSITPAERYFP
jgi:hypothetical protein